MQGGRDVSFWDAGFVEQHAVRCVCNLLHVLMSLLRGGLWLPRGEYSTEIYLDLELMLRCEG